VEALWPELQAAVRQLQLTLASWLTPVEELTDPTSAAAGRPAVY
jgi:hypothetical protein